LKESNGKKFLGKKLTVDYAYKKKTKQSDPKTIDKIIHGDVTSDNIIPSDNSYPNTRSKLKLLKK
jgi:hypothetical protein